jgi:hypothetical protein
VQQCSVTALRPRRTETSTWLYVGANILTFFFSRCGQWVHLDIIRFSLHSFSTLFFIVVIVTLVIIFAACFMTVVSDIFVALFCLLVYYFAPLKIGLSPWGRREF